MGDHEKSPLNAQTFVQRSKFSSTGDQLYEEKLFIFQFLVDVSLEILGPLSKVTL